MGWNSLVLLGITIGQTEVPGTKGLTFIELHGKKTKFKGAKGIRDLDLLKICFLDAWKKFQKYYPKWWCLMVMNPMVQSVKNHQQKQIQVFVNPNWSSEKKTTKIT